jgi:hypothetical protein
MFGRDTIEDEIGGEEDQTRGVRFAPSRDRSSGVKVHRRRLIAGLLARRGISHGPGVDHDRWIRIVESVKNCRFVPQIGKHGAHARHVATGHRGNNRRPARARRTGGQVREDA